MNETSKGMLREDKTQKPNYLSYIDVRVLDRYARHMKEGELKHGRGNWKKGGYPAFEYLESLMRHFVALWAEKEGFRSPNGEDHASAVLFNIMGFMKEEADFESTSTSTPFLGSNLTPGSPKRSGGLLPWLQSPKGG